MKSPPGFKSPFHNFFFLTTILWWKYIPYIFLGCCVLITAGSWTLPIHITYLHTHIGHYSHTVNLITPMNSGFIWQRSKATQHSRRGCLESLLSFSLKETDSRADTDRRHTCLCGLTGRFPWIAKPENTYIICIIHFFFAIKILWHLGHSLPTVVKDSAVQGEK